MFQFDTLAAGTEPSSDGGWTWTCTFHRGTDAFAVVEIRFDAELTVVGVRLDRPDGTSPTEISRFGWAHWAGVARDMIRARDAADGAPLAASMRGIMAAQEQARVASRRPGRGGHPDAFYEAVIEEYDALRRAGNKQPIVTLQRIYQDRGETYSRDTIRGWVKRAQELRAQRSSEAKGDQP